MQPPAKITSNVKHSKKSSSHQTTHLALVKSALLFTTQHFPDLLSLQYQHPGLRKGGDRDEARGLINLPKLFVVLLLLCAATVPHFASASVHLDEPNLTGISTGLVGYWPLDGNTTNWKTDTTQDTSGNGNTGTMVSMSTTSSPTAGKIGQALKFNGATTGVSLGSPTNAQLKLTNSSTITISAWVNQSAIVSTTQAVIGKDSVASGASGVVFNLYDSASGRFSFQFSDGTNIISATASPGNAIVANKWYFVAAVLNGTTASLYINNVLITTATNASFTGIQEPSSGQRVTGIGEDAQNSRDYWNGAIDDVRIYNRALSPQEGALLYALGQVKAADTNTTSITSGLVGYWPLDGNTTNWTTDTTQDTSGNGNTGTMVGMSTTTSPTPGKIGQALNFTGSGKYINLNTPSVLAITGTITMSAWVNITSFPTSYNGCAQNCGNIVTKGYDGSSEAWLLRYVNTGSQAEFQTGADVAGSNQVATANITFPLNTWHFILGEYDGTYWKLWIDGVLKATAAGTGATTASAPVLIGADSIAGTVTPLFPRKN
jgi:hypothetical protein